MILCEVFYTPYSKLNVFPYKLEKILMLVILFAYALPFSSFSAFVRFHLVMRKLQIFHSLLVK